jgi:hypothetical protein
LGRLGRGGSGRGQAFGGNARKPFPPCTRSGDLSTRTYVQARLARGVRGAAPPPRRRYELHGHRDRHRPRSQSCRAAVARRRRDQSTAAPERARAHGRVGDCNLVPCGSGRNGRLDRSRPTVRSMARDRADRRLRARVAHPLQRWSRLHGANPARLRADAVPDADHDGVAARRSGHVGRQPTRLRTAKDSPGSRDPEPRGRVARRAARTRAPARRCRDTCTTGLACVHGRAGRPVCR